MGPCSGWKIWPMGALAIVGALTLAACSEDTGGTVARSTTLNNVPKGTVLVKNIDFTPEKIVIKAGEVVTWRFEDGGITHTVTADGDSFDSGDRVDGEFQQRFESAGEFTYHCERHGAMNGTVVVE